MSILIFKATEVFRKIQYIQLQNHLIVYENYKCVVIKHNHYTNATLDTNNKTLSDVLQTLMLQHLTKLQDLNILGNNIVYIPSSETEKSFSMIENYSPVIRCMQQFEFHEQISHSSCTAYSFKG
ncbi:Hypothetical_protein [Hexamita inflata]|uniref:Hypothetical_protein n=1 Tax=Hexamita inflata TaxID=28002 RepID=A0AA86PE75_9EUKA|nr:Hypothetical protein HINF_LOCUS24567 [Hexamita inflata]